jgi:hypothetical protein
MKVNNVQITNMDKNGSDWWDEVSESENRSKPLIDAILHISCSWDEYEKLLNSTDQ